jgi:hypothetical protein
MYRKASSVLRIHRFFKYILNFRLFLSLSLSCSVLSRSVACFSLSLLLLAPHRSIVADLHGALKRYCVNSFGCQPIDSDY